MQRNSNDLFTLKFIFIVLVLITYQIASSVFKYIPPLIGIFFAYLIILNHEHEKTFVKFDYRWYLSLAYLLISEQLHGFSFLAIIITFLIFYYLIFDWLTSIIKFTNVLLVIFVTVGYLGEFLITNIFAFIKNSEYLNFGFEYVWYIVFESIFAIIFFRRHIL